MYDRVTELRCYFVATFTLRSPVRLAILLVLTPLVSLHGFQASTEWSQWRGATSTGVALNAKPPVKWSAAEQDSVNIRWKVKLPGRGHSTPALADKYVFVTSAIPTGEKLPPRMSNRPGEHDNLPVDSKFQFVVLCLNRKDGAIEWQKVVREEVPLEAGHYTASLASASPVTDGQFVYAHFGSHGVYCLNLQGDVVWERDFGMMHSKHGHGEGASPALVGDSLVINWDHEEGSFLVVLDTQTGKDRWRKPRQEDTSWSSPIVIEHEGRKQVIVCGTNRVRGYDLKSGQVLWECGGMSSNVVATPVFANGILYVGSSYEKKVLIAIDLKSASGDLTGTKHVLWTRTRGTPYVPSMLLYDDALYFLTHYQNVLTRVDGPNGKDAPGAIRLGALGNIYSSPVAANGNIYISDLEGTTMVITHDANPKVVSVNKISEPISASAAIDRDEIFLRGNASLYCIGEGAVNN
jgi:outer membrane protein assembly factor BamB